eukprot:6063685-Alexandrium_andersonii.AAC.1
MIANRGKPNRIKVREVPRAPDGVGQAIGSPPQPPGSRERVPMLLGDTPDATGSTGAHLPPLVGGWPEAP